MKLLLVGSITNSEALYSDGVRKRFGGGVMYGGRTAAKLGIDTTALTIGAEDIEGGVEELKSLGIRTQRVRRAASNNFSNDYRGSKRKLLLRSYIDTPLGKDDMDEDLNVFDCVILCPIFNEIDSSVISKLSNSLILLDPQGLTRRLGAKTEDGLYQVEQGGWDNIQEFAGKIDVLKLSNEDLSGIEVEGENEEEKMVVLSEKGFPMTILTRGEQPVILLEKNKPLSYIVTFPPSNSSAENPAGPGEIFAVAFMYKYFETKDARQASIFANLCVTNTMDGNSLTDLR